MLCVPVFMAIYSMKLFIGPQAHAGEIMEMRNRSALSRDTPPTPGTGKSFLLLSCSFNFQLFAPPLSPSVHAQFVFC